MRSTENVYAGGKLLNGINIIYVNSLACVRVNGCKSECFRISSGVRQVCIISPWLFNCIYGRSDEGIGNGDGEEGSEISSGGKRVEIA